MLLYLFFSATIPVILWLGFGAPDLNNSANALFFSVTVLHLYVLIWQRKVFKWLGGDFFTYGAANFAFNLLSLIYTVVLSFLVFHRSILFEWLFGKSYYQSIDEIPRILVGFMLAGLVVTLAMALFSSRRLERLPSKSDRRSFETPGDGGT
jgi:hypothetical protein